MDVTATIGTWLWVCRPMRGCARTAAWLLGALAGRKAPLLLSTWLDREGSEWMAATVPSTHTITTSHRKRTTPRPSAS